LIENKKRPDEYLAPSRIDPKGGITAEGRGGSQRKEEGERECEVVQAQEVLVVSY